MILAPAAQQGLRAGVELLADAIAPTLGPAGRAVAVSRVLAGARPPEILDDGAAIARRITALPDANADMGAMLLRQALWRIHESVGGGTATGAVFCRALVREGARQRAAGTPARVLAEGIDWATERTLCALRGQARPIAGQAALTACARGLCHDAELAALIGEALDVVGVDGYIIVREAPGRGVDREYVEGSHWPGSWIARDLAGADGQARVALDDAAVLLTDLPLTDADDVAHLLALVREVGAVRLLLVAPTLGAAAAAVLHANNLAGSVRSLPITLEASGDAYVETLTDLALLSGATPLLGAAGGRLAAATVDDLGRARHVWATTRHVGLAGGGGRSVALRARIVALRQHLATVYIPEERAALSARIGRLLGGMATIFVGGDSEPEREARLALAERTIAGGRQALAGGVVAGGGSSLVRVAAGLQAGTCPGEFASGVAAVARALAAPLETIVRNAGGEPAPIRERVLAAPPGYGWDARSGTVIDFWEVGIVDPVEQLATVVQIASRTAALLLTTEVLVRHKHPTVATAP